MGLVMKRAGATVPSANRITLLRDTDGDGVADLRSVLLQGLNSPFGMALVGNDALRGRLRRGAALSLCRRRHPHYRARHQAGRSAGGPDQPPLDQEPHREPGRQQALRDGGLEQQRGRTGDGGGGGACRHLGGGRQERCAPHLRLRPAQPQWPGLGTWQRRLVDGGERTRRARQRSGSRLPDLGARRRLLRLALQLLRPACRLRV